MVVSSNFAGRLEEFALQSAAREERPRFFSSWTEFEVVIMQAPAMLAEALQLLRENDYTIREEYLDGAGGGHCSFAGKKWLLLDVTQSTQEQLTDAMDALRCEPQVRAGRLSPELAKLLAPKRAA
jgi:hypothetical protein